MKRTLAVAAAALALTIGLAAPAQAAPKDRIDSQTSANFSLSYNSTADVVTVTNTSSTERSFLLKFDNGSYTRYTLAAGQTLTLSSSADEVIIWAGTDGLYVLREHPSEK